MMHKKTLHSFASMAIHTFAEAAPTMSYREFADACRARLAKTQGVPSPYYERSYAAYESMCRAAYRIHCQRAAEAKEALHANSV
ncbi:hypothetical protein CCAX7_14780 [Capsulimonas corticalis]|uniref:Uncharacterized protein n=1 Tax=Capsulimonas corticalis TaxID=2219043 RepID=A0A402CZG2_9BACT|nr:hypothetical protein [Capsulimonas corticalis]BDI29427.1 hypothetical protein CCAX7_14780 [Capsulimonas corticalis]